MYVTQSLLVLAAVFACIFAEAQDQEAAEQFFRNYGIYPSWYNHYNYDYAVSSYPYGTAHKYVYNNAYYQHGYVY